MDRKEEKEKEKEKKKKKKKRKRRNVIKIELLKIVKGTSQKMK